MIICQYDIDKIDLATIESVLEYANTKCPEETFIAIPSGLTIAELSDEYGIETLKSVHRHLGKIIETLQQTVNHSDLGIDDAIRYLDIRDVSPYYQDAWERVKKHYGIELDDRNKINNRI